MDEPLPTSRPRLRAALALVVLAIFITGALARAHIRPLWHDELFTWSVAQQPGAAGVWQALLTGVDLNPPLYYLLVQRAAQVTTAEAIAVRAPAVLGFAVLLLSLAAFIRTRCGSMLGGVAAAIVGLSGVAPYAYEGRPYGLVLGCAGLALLAWQQAHDATRVAARAAWTLLLFVALAAGLATHYYAVLLPIPLVAGEIVRGRRGRGWTLAIGLAVVAPVMTLWFWRPLIEVARGFSGTFWSRPTAGAVLAAYQSMLATLGAPLVLALATLAIVAGLIRAGWLPPARTPRGRPGVPGHELVVLAVFAALPLLGVLVALAATGAWHERYALSAIVGIAGLAAAGLHASGTLAVRTVSTVLLVAFTAQGIIRALDLREPPRLPAALDLVSSIPLPDMPLLASDGLTFVELAHYAPSDLAARLVYGLKPPSVIARTGTDSENRALQQLSALTASLRLERFEPFVSNKRPFAVIGRRSWVLDELRSRDLPLQWLAGDGDLQLFVIY